MALKRIQDLDPAAALDGTELAELEQAGASVQCTVQDIAVFADASGGGRGSVVAGTGIDVDNTDPENPVVSVVGGSDNLSLITEATAFTATPTTHDGRSRLTLAGGD